MNKLIAMSVGAIMLCTAAIAQTSDSAKTMTSLPSPSISISDLYKQNVYDPADNKRWPAVFTNSPERLVTQAGRPQGQCQLPLFADRRSARFPLLKGKFVSMKAGGMGYC